jgi:hypothetical protein
MNLTEQTQSQPTQEELMCYLMLGVYVKQDYIDAMKKLYEVCHSQNQMAN